MVFSPSFEISIPVGDNFSFVGDRFLMNSTVHEKNNRWWNTQENKAEKQKNRKREYDEMLVKAHAAIPILYTLSIVLVYRCKKPNKIRNVKKEK